MGRRVHLVLNAVFYFAALAVELLVQLARCPAISGFASSLQRAETRRLKALYRIFTARAASSTTVATEMNACSIINSLAQRVSTGQSVGENAVLVLNARNR